MNEKCRHGICQCDGCGGDCEECYADAIQMGYDLARMEDGILPAPRNASNEDEIDEKYSVS